MRGRPAPGNLEDGAMKKGTNGWVRKGPLRLREPGVPKVATLIDLVRHKAAAGRRSVAAIGTALFAEAPEARLSDRERVLMSEILRKLVHAVESSIRHDLAQTLAGRKDNRHDLVAGVANTRNGVTHSILAAGGELNEPDLIETARHRTQAHQLAGVLRKRLMESDPYGAGAGGLDVVASLLRNADATVSRRVMEYLISESKRVDTFQNPLLQFRDLSNQGAARLYWNVAAVLRQLLIDGFESDQAELDDALEGAVVKALAGLVVERAQSTAAAALIDELVRCRELTEALILRLLRQGEITLFEAAFARATRLGPRLAARLLYEPGGEGLAVACRAAGFTASAVSEIFDLTRHAGLMGDDDDGENGARLAAFFDRVPRPAATAVVRYWRRDRGYVAAMARLGATVSGAPGPTTKPS